MSSFTVRSSRLRQVLRELPQDMQAAMQVWKTRGNNETQQPEEPEKLSPLEQLAIATDKAQNNRTGE